jgi:restriction system protein
VNLQKKANWGWMLVIVYIITLFLAYKITGKKYFFVGLMFHGWIFLSLVKYLYKQSDTDKRPNASGKIYILDELPCSHGIVKAKNNPSLCPVCFAEIKRQEAIQCERIEKREKKRKEKLKILEKRKAEQKRKQLEKLKRHEYLKQLDPIKFEILMCKMFEKLDYSVERTKASGDNGADGILHKEGRKFILQVKRVKSSVGEPILRDLLGTMVHFKADGGIVATTGNISRQARSWLKGKPIRIYKLDEIVETIRDFFTEEDDLPRELVEPTSLKLPPKSDSEGKAKRRGIGLCKKCGSRLIKKKNRRGQYFYGCEIWPKCTYTKSIRNA